MTDDQRTEPGPKPPEPKRPARFSFNISFGRKPPVDSETYQRLLERATKDAELSPDGTGSASDTYKFKIDFSNGELRVQDSDRVPPAEEVPPMQEETAEAEMWDRIAHIGTGAYPDTARVHRALKKVVTVLGMSIPVAVCILTIATGQSQETIFFMTLFGLIVGVMIISTIPGMR